MAGVVFYEGPSAIDGRPIVAIATTGTRNKKTGPLVQTWILRADVSPVNAINTGADSSVCGSCPLRGIIANSTRVKRKKVNRFRSCYVRVGQAPNEIWKAYRRGAYPTLDALSPAMRRALRNSLLRRGSYGDPVAVPRAAWDALAELVKPGKHPGYTHQWDSPAAAGWQTDLMASVQTLDERARAVAAGWRTFRIVKSVDELQDGEILCPASPEAGSTKTCEQCGACNGRRDSRDLRHSVAIPGHGSRFAVLPSLLRLLDN